MFTFMVEYFSTLRREEANFFEMLVPTKQHGILKKPIRQILFTWHHIVYTEHPACIIFRSFAAVP